MKETPDKFKISWNSLGSTQSLLSSAYITDGHWFYTAVTHDPAISRFSAALLSDSNYSPINSITSFDSFADSGLSLTFNPAPTRNHIFAIADFALYKHQMPSLASLASFQETPSLLAFYSLRDFYLAD